MFQTCRLYRCRLVTCIICKATSGVLWDVKFRCFQATFHEYKRDVWRGEWFWKVNCYKYDYVESTYVNDTIEKSTHVKDISVQSTSEKDRSYGWFTSLHVWIFDNDYPPYPFGNS